MNGWRRKALPATLLTLVLTAGVVGVGLEYRSGSGFHPFETDRQLQNNQVLFPDTETGAGVKQDTKGQDSFWEKDRDEDDSAHTGTGGYLFDQGAVPAPGEATAGILTPGGNGAENGTPGAGEIFEITPGGSGTDLILPGGDAGLTPGGDGGETGGGSGQNSGDSGTSGGNGGGTNADDSTPGGGDNPDTSKVPAMGGEVAGDPDEDKKNPPSAILGDKDTYNESKLPDTLDSSRIYVVKPFGSEVAGLYTGQTVNRTVIYNALDTYVRGTDGVTYVWGAEALDTYITIDAVAFDSEDGPWYDLSKGQTLTIPTAVETLYLKVRYRLHQSDPWQELTPAPSYQLEKSRVMILNTRLYDGEKIDSGWVLNEGAYSQNLTPGTKLNLLYWSNYLIRQRSDGTARAGSLFARSEKLQPLTALFPGWTENGKPVEWFYPVTAGRHVLEAADDVPLDTDRYQAELLLYWMDEDYTVHASAENLGSLCYLQTLTYCKGGTYDWDTGTYHFSRIAVPDYIQAVDVPYSGISTDYLDLPASVLYVNTTGIEDPLEFCLGLEVEKGYTVAAGNPRYTAKNGVLYNLDQTEILGVPREISTLRVGANVTRVVLPGQSRIQKLVLEADSLDKLPEINYEKLNSSCRIVVPDALLNDYLRESSALLLAKRLKVSAAGASELAYHIQDGLALSDEGGVHLVLDGETRWLSLPDSVTGLESSALTGLSQLSMVFLPKSGAAITMQPGCLDGLPALTTVICYSQAQYDAAVKAAPAGVEVQLLTPSGVGGYSYIETNGRVMLLSVPKDIQSFDGTVPTEDGTVTVDAIGDGAFRDCDQLRWVTLPEQTIAIGYQAFAGCSALEGVLINTPESILIGQEAFSGCSSLRFVASNAKNGELKDASLVLDSGETEPYNFLYAPTENTGYSGSWTYFSKEDDLVRYELVDCGGTRVLYGVNSAGKRWIALRSGAKADGPVTLPAETEQIYVRAFEGLRSSTDGILSVNWDALNELFYIWRRAFSGSDLGGAVTLPADVNLETEAFRSCTRLTEITVPSSGFGVGVASLTFSGCTALKKATIGDVNYWYSLGSNAFSKCDALEEIVFTGGVPKLTLFEGTPFAFNDEWSTEREAQLKLTVENPEQYLEQWRYPFAGYFDSGYSTAYQNMWNTIWQQLYDWDNWVAPDDDAVFAEVDRQLLTAENRLRSLLGMELLDQISHTYTYEVDEAGMVTLTAARGVTSTDFSAGELEMPSGWALDYVGADAFAQSPDLRDVTLPETLAGICDGAFRGVQFDPAYEEILLMWIDGGSVPALIPAQEGQPFDFGVEDSRIRLISLSSYVLENILRDWLYPMAGYTDAEAMEAAVPDEAERMTLLLEAENRLRVLLDMDPIDSVDDMLGLTDRIETEEPDLPDWPDWPEWPDDFAAPSAPAEDAAPADPDAQEPSGTEGSPEETEPAGKRPDEDAAQPDPEEAAGAQEQEEETEE